MTDKIWKIGTRGSALALAQAEMTETALRAAYPGIQLERVVIKTTGDLCQNVSLSELSGTVGPDGEIIDKGVFTKELEIALMQGEIDVAVHSLKDVPTQVADAFAITGVLERAPIEDVLITRAAGDLADGAVLGTSSVRRAKQILRLLPGLEVKDIRGNVPTRLRKVAVGDYDATLLAKAGLVRLGFDLSQGVLEVEGGSVHARVLDESEMLPAAGQGAVGFEIRKDDADAAELIAGINHDETWARVRCEREFLRLLDAGCETPIGVRTELEGSAMRASAVVFDDDGTLRQSRGDGAVSDPEALAALLFNELA
ncbi:hydroxymethylbilane synthase [Sulfuriroseicoccus oceanibius]|uniref:Porphobilinogen deaminase n=1 Tax=Sulfuriroseicoccus oceanibius TaxID=2707525 RepID=A0A6B3L2Q0_9BACT|nr:hydroxymethylbilane synthase [Sulfuriroseicoccus oceanibius]QQL44334.1 hydroxymethylbilane synthase [Sulfuriroseicoccus oceanibius]